VPICWISLKDQLPVAKLHWCHANGKKLSSSVCSRQPSDQRAAPAEKTPSTVTTVYGFTAAENCRASKSENCHVALHSNQLQQINGQVLLKWFFVLMPNSPKYRVIWMQPLQVSSKRRSETEVE